MSIVLNPDKSVRKKARKQIAKAGGFCPVLEVDAGIKYNCKNKCCDEFEDSNLDICPLGMWIKGDN